MKRLNDGVGRCGGRGLISGKNYQRKHLLICLHSLNPILSVSRTLLLPSGLLVAPFLLLALSCY